MNKLPKEIYVDETSDEPVFFVRAEHAARTGETVTLGVYKLVGKVEVSTQIKQEVVIKKSPKKPAAKGPLDHSVLLDEIQAALCQHQPASAE